MKFGATRGTGLLQVICHFDELWLNFVEAQIFGSGYLAHFLSSRDEIWQR